MAYSQRVDFVGDTIIYKGEALPGTLDSVSGWRIKKIEFIGVDADVKISWANGTELFDKAWSNRLTYTYL